MQNLNLAIGSLVDYFENMIIYQSDILGLLYILLFPDEFIVELHV